MSDRELAIVVFGATGFTGRLAARYLADHAPKGLRWGIAGRDRGKLDALAATLGAAAPEKIVADSGDGPAIAAMVRRARVVVSTAGPFARWSDPVVAACVEARTHYCDITGETPWVRRLVDRHHARAAVDGTRIVPCCGFDSIPSDIGTWLVVSSLRRELGQGTRRVRASFVVGGGGLNGGTAASALSLAETGDTRALDDPLLLVPAERRAAIEARPWSRWPRRSETKGKWLAPFVMAPVNTQIVLRSAALYAERGEPYGPLFSYDEALEVKGRLAATGIAAALVGTDKILGTRPGRALLRRLVPAPGEGPSEEAMARGFFRTRLEGEATDGRRWSAELSYPGDAGNRSTVLMLIES
ncbi:MAG: trans-acting enoyl reductase family protein, partial [Planctomycetota bacterium]